MAIKKIIFLVLFIYGCAKPAIEVPATLNIVNVTMETEEEIKVVWRISPINNATHFTVAHTAIHYDTVSHAGILTTLDTPAEAGYANFTKDFMTGEFPPFSQFTARITVPRATDEVYLRVHAFIKSSEFPEGINVWTEEFVATKE